MSRTTTLTLKPPRWGGQEQGIDRKYLDPDIVAKLANHETAMHDEADIVAFPTGWIFCNH